MSGFGEYSISTRVRDTIKRYSLIAKNETVVVAFSGGKDSLFLVQVLSKLGFSVLPVLVNIGINKRELDLVDRVCYGFGVKFEIIDINDDSLFNQIELDYMLERFDFLKRFNQMKNVDINPCTQCYNVKVVALRGFCRKAGIRKIALGHHYNDVLVSFLKSVFYYIDRWDYGHKVFSIKNYYDLVLKSQADFTGKDFYCSNMYKKIELLVRDGVVSTDEAPLDDVGMSGYETMIIRPLFDVLEGDIKKYYNAQEGFVDVQGCVFKDKNSITPREIVKKEIVDMINMKYYSGCMFMRDFVTKNITNQGRLRINVRNNRVALLGVNYKNGVDSNKL